MERNAIASRVATRKVAAPPMAKALGSRSGSSGDPAKFARATKRVTHVAKEHITITRVTEEQDACAEKARLAPIERQERYSELTCA